MQRIAPIDDETVESRIHAMDALEVASVVDDVIL